MSCLLAFSHTLKCSNLFYYRVVYTCNHLSGIYSIGRGRYKVSFDFTLKLPKTLKERVVVGRDSRGSIVHSKVQRVSVFGSQSKQDAIYL